MKQGLPQVGRFVSLFFRKRGIVCMFDALIIGCGITGAAMAYELSKYALTVGILERENDVADGTTKANSAILHAGYDPKPGTLMAKLNVRGSVLAKQLCQALDVPYVSYGSLVLAFSAEEEKTLETLLHRGQKNGVPQLRLLNQTQLQALEPGVSPLATAALYATTAAICSPWEYCLALAETAVRNGAALHLETEVTGLTRQAFGWTVHTNRGDFQTRLLINAAGVDAARIHDLALPHDYDIHPTRGEYFLLDKSEGKKASHVLFQCPGVKGKGVLVAPTVHGNLIAGPNAEAVPKEDTSNTAAGMDFVRERAAKTLPGIDFRQSIRNFAGVRANTGLGDFVIRLHPEGFLDLAGICSPGLTAAPAIAEYACGLLREAGWRLEEKEGLILKRRRIRFKELSAAEKEALIQRSSAYGRVICRCETVTEGEILAAFRAPIPPRSVDAVKRRVNAGMGRCQGGFCGPRVVELLARELGISPGQVLQDKAGTKILLEPTKGGWSHV